MHRVVLGLVQSTTDVLAQEVAKRQRAEQREREREEKEKKKTKRERERKNSKIGIKKRERAMPAWKMKQDFDEKAYLRKTQQETKTKNLYLKTIIAPWRTDFH